MALIRFRGNKWQARVSRRGEQSLVKTFQSKEDAERWARSIEVEWDKGTYQIPTKLKRPPLVNSYSATFGK
jgi:succinyl-CoA synthetase beta subunit